MDFYHRYEQQLREEVIYLHSLWQQGPPGRRNPNPSTSRTLQPWNPTQFKERRRVKKNKRPLISNPTPISDIEWPCNPPPAAPPVTDSGWPELKLHRTSTTRPASAEEQARMAADKAQRDALKSTLDFFKRNAGSDGDEEDESDEDEDEDDLMDEDRELKFFVKLFMDDGELRGYYEKNYEKGGFSCLVCFGSGQKIGKKFRDCVSLVQHSVSIANTKKKRAHRAYGHAICGVLRWDINRLPINRGKKSGETEANTNGDNSVNVGDGESLPSKDCNIDGDSPHDMPNVVDSEKSISGADANNSSEIMEGNAEAMVEPEPLKDDSLANVGNESKDDQKDSVVLEKEPLKDDSLASVGNESKDDQNDNVVLDKEDGSPKRR